MAQIQIMTHVDFSRKQVSWPTLLFIMEISVGFRILLTWPTIIRLCSVLILSEHMYFKVNVASCGSKNKYQKDMSLKQIGVRAQNTIAILDLIIIIT